jgi:hypothetical protein
MFWKNVQESVLMVFDAVQREQWRKMVEAPIDVDFREGYPFDGKDVDLPASTPPPFVLHSPWRGTIVVMQTREDHGGSGFGHKAFVNAKQSYSWAGKNMSGTARRAMPGALGISASPRRDRGATRRRIHQPATVPCHGAEHPRNRSWRLRR